MNWHDAIRFPLSDFLKIYFAQSAFKDGLHGLMLSLFQAFYSFCTFAKLWEMEKFGEREVSLVVVEKEFIAARHDIGYWLLSAKISHTTDLMKKLWYRLLRKYAR